MKIDHVLISHLHGDHCYGLPGLLTSFALYGRSTPLYVYGPSGIKKYIEVVLESSYAHLPYALHIQEYDARVTHQIELYDTLTVHTFPLEHRVPTMGFRLQEGNLKRNIDTKKIEQYKLEVSEIRALKEGKNVERERGVLDAEDCLLPPTMPRSYAYCSDTVYTTSIVPHVHKVDLLYHETTYLKELAHLAQERLHTTLEEAIDIAQRAEVGRLISGHYSSRYHDLSEFEQRGTVLFHNFVLGIEGLTLPIRV